MGQPRGGYQSYGHGKAYGSLGPQYQQFNPHGQAFGPSYNTVPFKQPFMGAYNQAFQPQLPFLSCLNLLDLSKLTNDPLCHDPTWPPVPTKLPSDIPKFEGKGGEDPGDHVTTFHLWCSSNSLNHDSIRLCLFQCTLAGAAVKWYVELPGNTYRGFNEIALVFLDHFQLPVRYDTGTELLSTFRQNKATHISDHV